jgi:hypothetical protein
MLAARLEEAERAAAEKTGMRAGGPGVFGPEGGSPQLPAGPVR